MVIHALARKEAIEARGVANNIVEDDRLLSMLASSDRYCHPADGVFNSNSVVALDIRYRSGSMTKKSIEVLSYEIEIMSQG